MPRKPKRGCAYPGCAKLVDGQYCDKHKKVVQKYYDRYHRSENYNKKYGRSWRKVRRRYVKRHPLCEICLAIGKITPVEEVHHIVPISQGGTNDEENLQSLCQSCHTKVHQELGDR